MSHCGCHSKNIIASTTLYNCDESLQFNLPDSISPCGVKKVAFCYEKSLPEELCNAKIEYNCLTGKVIVTEFLPLSDTIKFCYKILLYERQVTVRVAQTVFVVSANCIGGLGGQGYMGNQGRVGSLGNQGVRGSQGYHGSQAARGPQGSHGTQGPAGGTSPVTPGLAQQVFVSKAGSDITGDGTINNPYLTIPHAQSTITMASTALHFEIVVGPGRFAEDFAIIPWVWITGSGPLLTYITATNVTLDATWSTDPSTDMRAGFSELYLRAPSVYTFDFAAVSGSTGKLYFNNIQALNLAFVAYNQINQVFVQNCAFYGSWTQTGMNAIISNTFFINQNPIVINGIHNGDNFRTSFTAFGGAADGTLSAIFTPNIGTNDNAVSVNLNSFPVDGGITIDGANNPNAVVVPFLSATADSIVGTVTLLNSAPFPTQYRK